MIYSTRSCLILGLWVTPHLGWGPNTCRLQSTSCWQTRTKTSIKTSDFIISRNFIQRTLWVGGGSRHIDFFLALRTRCGARRIGARSGATCGSCPLEFEINDVICCFVRVKYLKFSLEPSAPELHTLKLSLNSQNNSVCFRLRLRRAENGSFLSVHAILPPSGKFSEGAHMFRLS